MNELVDWLAASLEDYRLRLDVEHWLRTDKNADWARADATLCNLQREVEHRKRMVRIIDPRLGAPFWPIRATPQQWLGEQWLGAVQSDLWRLKLSMYLSRRPSHE